MWENPGVCGVVLASAQDKGRSMGASLSLNFVEQKRKYPSTLA